MNNPPLNQNTPLRKTIILIITSESKKNESLAVQMKTQKNSQNRIEKSV